MLKLAAALIALSLPLDGFIDTAAAAAPAAALRAGSAKVEITPPASALKPGDSIRDPLYVRAIVLDNGLTCAALVGVDQAGIRSTTTDAAIARATKSIGCPADHFIVSATHTHSGSTGGLGGPGKPDAKDVEEAIVSALTSAKSRLRPARIGFGTTDVHLNVNRDLFDNQKWIQGPNPDGHSDKTLAVLEFIGTDDLPIGVYLNYAMHPIDFYLSGVVSADFPGEASRYIERRYGAKTVAVFAQGASGNQNPLFTRPMHKLLGTRARSPGITDNRITAQPPWRVSASELNANARHTREMETPVRPEEQAAYTEAVTQTGEFVSAMGALIGESAIDVMRNRVSGLSDQVTIGGASESFSCPGRDRLDTSAREGVLPPYADGAPVNIKVGMLRVGDIALASVNGEVYSEIAARLKRESPVSKLMLVTLANGMANSGYIYSNEAGSHLTFQVIGSRLKPGCAEDKIVATSLALLQREFRQ
jgi:neutral ceramidase